MEGTLFKKLDGGKIQCTACSRYCVLSEGEYGFCGVRKNIKGKLNLEVYGKPCAIAIDPIEKKPLFNFLPGSKSYSIGTYGCNFSCKFCQNWEIAQAPKEYKTRYPQMLKNLKNITPSEVVNDAVKSSCKSIAYTYNEPTVFSEYAHDIGVLARKKGLKNIFVTNGYETKECWDYLSEFVDAVNIDLKGDEKFYNKLSGGVKEKAVKDSIKYAKEIGMWVEITTLLIDGENTSVDFINKASKFLFSVDSEMPWHLTAFYPQYKMLNKAPTQFETLMKARIIAEENGLKYIYCGNTASRYENTYCPNCKMKLIERLWFEVRENKLIDGKCPHCGHKIAGVYL